MRHATVDAKAAHLQDRLGREYLARLKPGKHPKREHGGYMMVAVYLCALTWRVMNDRHLADRAQPTHAQLSAALRCYMDKYLSKFLLPWDPTARPTPYQRFAYLEDEQADYLADSLATSLLRDWKPEWIEEQQRRGTVGGLAGKPRRPTKATDENRRKLATLRAENPGWTQVRLANELGVSVSTIKRIS